MKARDNEKLDSTNNLNASERDAMRQNILQAALTVFSRNGFKAATMRAIAKEANISPGLTYSYFDTKDELLEEILVQFLQHRKQMIEPLLQTHPEPKQFLDAMVEQWFKDILKHEDYYRIYFTLLLQKTSMKKMKAVLDKFQEINQYEQIAMKEVQQQMIKHQKSINASVFRAMLMGSTLQFLIRGDKEQFQNLKKEILEYIKRE